jgi:ABC-type transporter Mla subunit MlaD
LATRAQKAKVGLFVVICGFLIVGGIMLIRGYKIEERFPYWIEFDESVLGLGMGGLVEYLGVPVGAVSNIYVTDQNKAHVDVLISTDKVTLKEGVKARLVLYSFATGTMCVSLEGGEGNRLPPGSEIHSEKSLITAVSSQIEGILGDMRQIAEMIKNGLTGMQEGDLASLFQDADSLITRGQEFLDTANQTIADVKGEAESGLQDFRDLVAETKKLLRDTDEAIKKAAKKIETLRVSETEENVNKALQDFSALSKRLQESVDNVTRRALHEADNVEYNLRETLRTLNESLEAVRELMQYLQQDPSALIRGKGKPKGER